MANNGKNAVTKAQAEAHRRTLSQLLRTEDNRRCADCLARGPTWASVNLGVFVCLNCSGIHRSLGTDLSKVRSTTLDTWLPDQVAFVQRMGNRKANLFWEGQLPKKFRRPAEGDMLGLRHFINDKYRDRLYALKTWDKPPTIETYMVHPFLKEIEGAAAEQQGTSEASASTLDSRQNATSPDATRRRSQAGLDDAGNLKAPPQAQSRRFGSTTRRPSSPALQPPATPAAAPELFDLLSLDGPESAPASSTQGALPPLLSNPAAAPSSGPRHRSAVSQESFADTASSDGGWAAFVGGSTAAGPAAADDTWDAFQDSSTEAGTSRDPFAPADASSTAEGQQTGSFQPKFPSAPSSPGPPNPPLLEKGGKHRPQKSAEEIMRMFDQPKQQDNLFNATFPPLPEGPAGSFPGASSLGVEGVPPNLWPPFPMPPGMLGPNGMALPPQMLGLPPFPDSEGWATMPPMPPMPNPNFGANGSSKGFF